MLQQPLKMQCVGWSSEKRGHFYKCTRRCYHQVGRKQEHQNRSFWCHTSPWHSGQQLVANLRQEWKKFLASSKRSVEAWIAVDVRIRWYMLVRDAATYCQKQFTFNGSGIKCKSLSICGRFTGTRTCKLRRPMAEYGAIPFTKGPIGVPHVAFCVWTEIVPNAFIYSEDKEKISILDKFATLNLRTIFSDCRPLRSSIIWFVCKKPSLGFGAVLCHQQLSGRVKHSHGTWSLPSVWQALWAWDFFTTISTGTSWKISFQVI